MKWSTLGTVTMLLTLVVETLNGPTNQEFVEWIKLSNVMVFRSVVSFDLSVSCPSVCLSVYFIVSTTFSTSTLVSEHYLLSADIPYITNVECDKCMILQLLYHFLTWQIKPFPTSGNISLCFTLVTHLVVVEFGLPTRKCGNLSLKPRPSASLLM